MKLNAIKEMENFARYQKNVVSLSQGIPFLAADDVIREGAMAAIQEGKVDAYSDPQGILELRQALSDNLKQENMYYTPSEIVITAGAIEAFAVTAFNLISPDRDEIIIPTPAYSAYFKVVSLAKGRAVPVVLDEQKNWELDQERLEASITRRTAAILICNPNNPTGSLYSPETLNSVCVIARRYGIKVILDEVYRNILFDDKKLYVPCTNPRFRKDIIRIVSFSKDFSLTGWRVGFIHTDKSIINTLVGIHDTLINCAPVVSQYAALAALRHQERIFTQNREVYNRHRDIMKSYLDIMSDHLDYIMPSGSYFFFPRFVKPCNSADFCFALLRAEKVAIVPGSAFGDGGENHVRICFGKDETSIHKGMEGLTRFITQGTPPLTGVPRNNRSAGLVTAGNPV